MLNNEELRIAKRKYMTQRRDARSRGIEFNFTFDEWLQVWLNSGCWDKRGKSADSYVMARNGDIGPYRKDNVQIKSNSANVKEMQIPKFSCIHCHRILQTPQIKNHYGSQRCRQKKAPRYRVLS
jgi:hypothetical protein